MCRIYYKSYIYRFIRSILSCVYHTNLDLFLCLSIDTMNFIIFSRVGYYFPFNSYNMLKRKSLSVNTYRTIKKSLFRLNSTS